MRDSTTRPSLSYVCAQKSGGGEAELGQVFLRYDQQLARKHYRGAIHFAYDYAMIGRKEETLRALEDAFQERDPWLVFLQKYQAFDFLHSEPRYRALVTKMGLPPAY